MSRTLTTSCCGRIYTSGDVIMGSSGMLEAIRWQMGPPASLRLLDQRLLPAQSVYIEVDGPQAAFTAIKVVFTCLDAYKSALARLHLYGTASDHSDRVASLLTQRSALSYNFSETSNPKKIRAAEMHLLV